MSFFPGNDPEPGDFAAGSAIEQLIIPRTSDLGGFHVRRALPTARRRLVGPFIFFDRMGPAILRPGQALDVRPHPHIGLSTVTYLFDGIIRHRDSLGTALDIAPGDVNLMTAGRGIVHSERTPDALRSSPQAISGLQTWLALPDGLEEIDPRFHHQSSLDLPSVSAGGVEARVVIGSFEGKTSPVPVPSGTLYVDLRLAPGAHYAFEATHEERAAYLLSGEVDIATDRFAPDQLLVFRPGDQAVIKGGPEGAHLMLFGGDAMASKRYVWWNFVSSSKERIEQAKQEWLTGRFDIVPGDEEEFIPLPAS